MPQFQSATTTMPGVRLRGLTPSPETSPDVWAEVELGMDTRNRMLAAEEAAAPSKPAKPEGDEPETKPEKTKAKPQPEPEPEPEPDSEPEPEPEPAEAWESLETGQ